MLSATHAVSRGRSTAEAATQQLSEIYTLDSCERCRKPSRQSCLQTLRTTCMTLNSADANRFCSRALRRNISFPAHCSASGRLHTSVFLPLLFIKHSSMANRWSHSTGSDPYNQFATPQDDKLGKVRDPLLTASRWLKRRSQKEKVLLGSVCGLLVRTVLMLGTKPGVIAWYL